MDYQKDATFTDLFNYIYSGKDVAHYPMHVTDNQSECNGVAH